MDKSILSKRQSTMDEFVVVLKRKKTTTDRDPVENDPERNDAVQEPEGDEEEEEGDTELKLEDLNDYCLEGVFKYLSLNDLVSVAESSDRFFDEVHFAARRIFREEEGTIDVGEGSILFSRIRKWEFKSYNLSEFFEMFGSEMFRLTIKMHERIYICDLLSVERLLVEYCSKRLTDLGMYEVHPSQEVLVGINKPLEALRQLTLGGTLPENFDFNK